jgi:hypothetical protein
MRSKRVKILKVDSQIIADLCKRAMKNNVPKDAEVIRVNYNALSNNFDIIIQSEEYPELKEGELIPELPDPVVSEDIFKP